MSCAEYQRIAHQTRLTQAIKEGKAKGSGIVVFKPSPNATLKEIEQVKAYIRGCNNAVQNGQLSPTGRVSTVGQLRREANRAAKKERKRAAISGSPYKGVPGHTPDTTWVGVPNPPAWLDLDSNVNSSLGAQSLGYPIGYKPIWFVYGG